MALLTTKAASPPRPRVQGGVLWKVHGDTGASMAMSSGWFGTEAMTYGDGFLYIARGDILWELDATVDHPVAQMIAPYGWFGVEGMTYREGFICGRPLPTAPAPRWVRAGRARR